MRGGWRTPVEPVPLPVWIVVMAISLLTSACCSTPVERDGVVDPPAVPKSTEIKCTCTLCGCVESPPPPPPPPSPPVYEPCCSTPKAPYDTHPPAEYQPISQAPPAPYLYIMGQPNYDQIPGVYGVDPHYSSYYGSSSRRSYGAGQMPILVVVCGVFAVLKLLCL